MDDSESRFRLYEGDYDETDRRLFPEIIVERQEIYPPMWVRALNHPAMTVLCFVVIMGIIAYAA